MKRTVGEPLIITDAVGATDDTEDKDADAEMATVALEATDESEAIEDLAEIG